MGVSRTPKGSGRRIACVLGVQTGFRGATRRTRTTHRRSRSGACAAGLALLLVLVAGPVRGQATGAEVEGTWDFGEVEGGRSYSTEIEVANTSCRGRHTLRIEIDGAPWLRVTSDATIEKLARGETVTPKLELDLRDLEPGHYSGLLVVRCLTCPPPPKCRVELSKLQVEVEVTAPEPAPCECTQLEQLADAARRDADEAQQEVRRLEGELEEAEKRLEIANGNLDETRRQRKDLEKYFDEFSWIAGDRGRITRGDLELLREARGEIAERWKAGAITAEEAVEGWRTIDAGSLDRLREQKRAERDAAEKSLERAGKEVQDAESQRAQAAAQLDDAKRRADEAEQNARAARLLYELCLARCAQARADLLALIDERIAEIERLLEDCPEEDTEAIKQELRDLAAEAKRLAEDLPSVLRTLDGAFRRMEAAVRYHGAGEKIPEEGFTGLWDWGEDLGRVLGRAAGLEEELATAGKVVSTTAGTVAEAVAGFPLGTDLVAKGVPEFYAAMLEKLDPRSPGFFRCLLKSKVGEERLLEILSEASRAWTALRNGRADQQLRSLGENVGRFGEQVDAIRATLDELRALGAEGVPALPEAPSEGATLDGLRAHEEALRNARNEIEARCLRLRALRKRLERQITGARSTLREIDSLRSTLAQYARGIAGYLDVHRRTKWSCL